VTNSTAKPQQRPQPFHQPPKSKGQSELRIATFTYFNAKAQKVCVAGDFNNWSTDAHPLLRTGGGVWVLQLKLTPGRHEYLFVVDGKWTPDRLALLSAPNPSGGKNSVMIA
jgi:1,4-alpha-glucan branching enzyme